MFSKRLATTHDKRELKFNLQIICAAFDFLMWIAPIEEICVLAIELHYIFSENDRQLWIEPT